MKFILWLSLMLAPLLLQAEKPMTPWNHWQRAAASNAQSGRFLISLEKMEAALFQARVELGSRSADLIPVLLDAATAAHRMARFEDALDYAQQALQLSQLHAQNSALIQHRLGNIYRDQGVFDKALEHYLAAQSGGAGSASAWDKARLEEKKGNHAEAEKQYRLVFAEQDISEEDRERLAMDIGRVALEQKKLPQALEFYTLSYQHRSNRLTKDHPFLADSLQGMGKSLLAMNRKKDASDKFIQAEKLRRRVMGPDSWEALPHLKGMAELYDLMGRNKESAVLFQRCAGIAKDVLGSEHPFTLSLQKHLAKAKGPLK